MRLVTHQPLHAVLTPSSEWQEADQVCPILLINGCVWKSSCPRRCAFAHSFGWRSRIVSWILILQKTLKWINCARQAMHISTTALTRVRTCAWQVSNLVTVVASAFLLSVSILGVSALFLGLSCLLPLPQPLLSLVLAVFRKVTFLQAHMKDSILRKCEIK